MLTKNVTCSLFSHPHSNFRRAISVSSPVTFPCVNPRGRVSRFNISVRGAVVSLLPPLQYSASCCGAAANRTGTRTIYGTTASGRHAPSPPQPATTLTPPGSDAYRRRRRFCWGGGKAFPHFVHTQSPSFTPRTSRWTTQSSNTASRSSSTCSSTRVTTSADLAAPMIYRSRHYTSRSSTS